MIFPAGLCIAHDGEDLDEMSEKYVRWGLEQFQFGKGRFGGQLRAVHTESLRIGWSRRSTGVLLRGQVPAGAVALCTVERAASPVHYRGAALDGLDIMALRHGEDIELSSMGSTEMISVTVETAVLERRIMALLGEPLDYWRRQERLGLVHPNRRTWLNRSLMRYLGLALRSGITACPNQARRLENKIIETILLNLAVPEVRLPRPQRLHWAKRAEDYLRAHADTPVSLTELCETVGTNQRMLFLGFQERFGISPKAYLKILRLNGARRELLRLEPETSVTAAAVNWGFWHLGRFSMEYRAMFDESPRQTLKKSFARSTCRFGMSEMGIHAQLRNRCAAGFQ